MSDASDRTIPATPRRREAARRAGLGAPADLPAWAASAATAIVLGPAWVRTTIPAAAESFREFGAAALAVGGSTGGVPWPLPLAVVLPTIGLVAASATAGLAVRFACDGVSWQPGRAAPDLRRVDPAAGLGRIFSRGTLASLATSAAALVILGVAAFVAARPLARAVSAPIAADEIAGLATVTWRFAVQFLAVAAAVAVGQWLVARRRFERRIRMTPRELAEEQKGLRSDPRVRLLERQRHQPAATRPGTP